MSQNLNEQSETICSTLEHNNPQGAQNIIDEQISRHEKSVIALKTLRNTLSPISKLPIEILCQIFYFSQEKPSYSLFNWIKITYVCRQWRTVALNSPNLWTNLPLGYGKWASVMLERSKRANLTVKVDFMNPRHNTRKHLESAFQHADRFRILSLENGDATVLRDLLSKLPKSAPRLHSLVLSVSAYRSSYYETLSAYTDVCDLPEAMLCETENLRSVELKSCNPCWDSHLFSSLSHLKIDRVSSAARPSTKQFSEMLKRMPNLESLELFDAIPVESSGSAQETIHLSGLHYLSLSSLPAEIGTLLRYITFPPSTRVKIVTTTAQVPDPNFSGMLSALSSTLSSTDKRRGLDGRRLLIGQSDLVKCHGVQIKASSRLETQSDIFQSGLENPDIELNVRYRQHAGSFGQFLDSVLRQVFDAFSLDNLSSLFLSDLALGSQIFFDLFSTLSRLESIVSTDTSTDALLKALQGTQTLGQAASPDKANIVFPRLRSLALADAIFEPDDDGSESDGIPVDLLHNFLKQRHMHGAELPELHLRNCYHLYTDDVDDCKEFVGDVHWDGIEQDVTDDESEEEDEDEYGDIFDDFDPDSDYDPYDYGWDY